MDLLWQDAGGCLVDEQGDLAMGDSQGVDSLIDMVRTRLKAALDGWQLYPIGADLESQIGLINLPERETAVQQLIDRALTYQYLPNNTFSIETLRAGDTMHVFVYIAQTLIGRLTLSSEGLTLN